jgi:hypothetical protein
MRSQPLNGRLSSKFAGSGAVRTALAGLSILAITATSVWASALTELESHLPTNKTILTATAAALAKAVYQAIQSNTDSTVTPAEIAAAAYTPSGTKNTVRADRNASAATVADEAISAILSSGTAALGVTSSNAATQIAAVVQELVDVNQPTKTLDLTVAGQTAVAKISLGVLSDYSVGVSATSAFINPTLTTVLDSAYTAIGNVLATDTTSGLLVAPKNGLVTALQTAIEGITGTKGKSTAAAPVAAEKFVAGILESGTVPDAETYPAFAVAILKDVAKNASVDELVANVIGGEAVNSSTTGLENLASALFAKYPTDVAKITQGLTADIAAENATEGGRVGLIEGILGSEPAITNPKPFINNAADVTSVAEGAVYVDPFFASQFTQGVFDALETDAGTAKKPFPLAVADAPAIAKGVSSVIGQDGDELANVAAVFAALSTSTSAAVSTVLPIASAGTYATALIKGAVTSTVLTSQFTGAAAGGGGGQLNVGQGKTPQPVTVETVKDLETIGDVFTNAIITDALATSGTGIATKTAAPKIATAIATLAEDIAKYTKNLTVTGLPASMDVSADLAASIANTVYGLALNNSSLTTAFDLTAKDNTTVEALILLDLGKDIEGVVNPTVKAAVSLVLSSTSNFTDGYVNKTGFAVNDETAVTNL